VILIRLNDHHLNPVLEKAKDESGLTVPQPFRFRSEERIMMRKAVSEFSHPEGFTSSFFFPLVTVMKTANLLRSLVYHSLEESTNNNQQQPPAKRRKEEEGPKQSSKSFGLSFSFTEPQAPVFRTDERAQAKKEAEEAAALAMATLANSSPHPSVKPASLLPVEGPPVFAVEERLAQRRNMKPPVKSTSEREEEELQKVFFFLLSFPLFETDSINSIHQLPKFKAMPLDERIIHRSVGDWGVPRVEKRAVTVPQSPMLHTKQRNLVLFISVELIWSFLLMSPLLSTI